MSLFRQILSGVGLLLLISCSGRDVVSRVPLPDSSVTVVLTEDFKHMYSAQLFENGKPVSDLQLLGPRYSDHCPPARVSSSSGLVTVDWGQDSPHHYVQVDVTTRHIVVSSNGGPKR
jgi:hypothetical protein